MNAETRIIDCAHVIGPKGPLAGAQAIQISDDKIASITPLE